MEWLSTWLMWLLLGFILLTLEVFIPGVFVMWWGLAAVVVAGIVALFPQMPVGGQIAIFAILTIVVSLLWWKYQHRKDRQDDRQSELNQRDHAMIGKEGVIMEILDNGVLRGKFGDTTWRVVGAGLNVGDRVKVVAVDGITLFVAK